MCREEDPGTSNFESVLETCVDILSSLSDMEESPVTAGTNVSELVGSDPTTEAGTTTGPDPTAQPDPTTQAVTNQDDASQLDPKIREVGITQGSRKTREEGTTQHRRKTRSDSVKQTNKTNVEQTGERSEKSNEVLHIS